MSDRPNLWDPTHLYRFIRLRPSETVLYVGITRRFSARLHQHEDSLPVYMYADRVDLWLYPTRELAAAAERWQVSEHRPTGNKHLIKLDAEEAVEQYDEAIADYVEALGWSHCPLCDMRCGDDALGLLCRCCCGCDTYGESYPPCLHEDDIATDNSVLDHVTDLALDDPKIANYLSTGEYPNYEADETDEPAFLTAKQVAEQLSVSEAYIKSLGRKHDLGRVRRGATYVYPFGTAERILDECCQPTGGAS